MNLQEQRRMQFLAGIISESELDSMNRVVTAHDVDTDAIENMPQVQMAADMIMSNPSALAQLEKFASIAGVDSIINETSEFDGQIDDNEIQKIANFIDDMIEGGDEIQEGDKDKKEEKPNLVVTAASLGGVLPFIPGISGLITQASEATGIPSMAFGAASVLAAAVIGGIINNIIKKRKEKKENLNEGWKDVASGAMMALATMLPKTADAQDGSVEWDTVKDTVEIISTDIDRDTLRLITTKAYEVFKDNDGNIEKIVTDIKDEYTKYNSWDIDKTEKSSETEVMDPVSEKMVRLTDWGGKNRIYVDGDYMRTPDEVKDIYYDNDDSRLDDKYYNYVDKYNHWLSLFD